MYTLAPAIYHVQFSSLNHPSHFDTESVSATGKLRSEARHKRSITSFHEGGDAENGLKGALRTSYKMFVTFSLCLSGPVFMSHPADDPLTQLA